MGSIRRDLSINRDQGDARAGFSLDFAGPSDAADSPLHQHSFGFFQGPTVQPESTSSKISVSQEETFPIPPSFLGSSSLSAPTPYPSASGVLPSETANNIEQRMFDEMAYLTDETQVLETQVADFGFGNGRNPIRFSSPLFISGNTSNADMVSHLPVIGKPYCPGGGTSRSPNRLKRPGNTISPLSQIRRMTEKKRPTDQAEHIIRERQRRDDMTSKFSLLESLLPPGSKRDRSTIVDDSIQYVKNLHHRLTTLQEKRSQMKSTAPGSHVTFTATGDKAVKQNPGNNLAGDVLATATASRDLSVSIRIPPGIRENMSLQDTKAQEHDHSKSMQNRNSRIKLRTYVEKVEVHLDLPHQLVIEMMCRPHRHIHSQILQALERLGLDVSRCSITKLQHRIFCIINVKPRVVTDFSVSGDDFMTALKCALLHDL